MICVYVLSRAHSQHQIANMTKQTSALPGLKKKVASVTWSCQQTLKGFLICWEGFLPRKLPVLLCTRWLVLLWLDRRFFASFVDSALASHCLSVLAQAPPPPHPHSRALLVYLPISLIFHFSDLAPAPTRLGSPLPA